MEDLAAWMILERVYDLVEKRYGTPAAWVVTIMLFAAIAALLIWTVVRFLG